MYIFHNLNCRDARSVKLSIIQVFKFYLMPRMAKCLSYVTLKCIPELWYMGGSRSVTGSIFFYMRSVCVCVNTVMVGRQEKRVTFRFRSSKF